MSSFLKRLLLQAGTLPDVDDTSHSKISSRFGYGNYFRSLALASFSVLMSSGMISWKQKFQQFTKITSQFTRDI
jgi:hypothetical protein